MITTTFLKNSINIYTLQFNIQLLCFLTLKIWVIFFSLFCNYIKSNTSIFSYFLDNLSFSLVSEYLFETKGL